MFDRTSLTTRAFVIPQQGIGIWFAAMWILMPLAVLGDQGGQPLAHSPFSQRTPPAIDADWTIAPLPPVIPAGEPSVRWANWHVPPVQTSLVSEQQDKDTLEERLEKLEKAYEKQQKTEEEEKQEALLKPTMRIGGRIHLDHWAYPYTTEGIGFFENPSTGVDPEDRFAFRRIRLEIRGDITPTMLYKFDIDFNNPGTPEYKDAYLGFQELPWNHTLLIGNQKRPLGLDHLNSSRFNLFMERPMVVEAFNEDARRLGIAAYGFSDDRTYNWCYGVYNLENTRSTGRYIGDSLQLSGNARLASSPWYDETSEGRGYFHWAVAGMVAHPDGNVDPRDSNENEGRFQTRSENRSTERWLDTGRIASAQWYEILGVESIVNVGPWQFVGEYQATWLQRDAGPELCFHGAYVYLAYFLTGEFVPLDRESGTIDRVDIYENFFLVERCCGGVGGGWGAWQVALRLSYLDLTDDDIEGGVGHNTTLGLNWYWTDHSKLQFNLIYGEVDEHRPVGGFTQGEFVSVGTRFVCDF
jgi:phosphate-selective porin OprO/OprP